MSDQKNPLQPTNSDLSLPKNRLSAHEEKVEEALGLIYLSYLNANLSEEFIGLMKTALLLYSDEEIEALADIKTGVATKHSFPPGLAELAKFIESYRRCKILVEHYREVDERRAQMTAIPIGAYRELPPDPEPSRPPPRPLPPRKKEPFRPFPKLWEAFADEPDLLDPQKNYLTFDRLFDASKALATRGKDAARTILEIRR